MLPERKTFLKPIHLSPNPRSRTIISNFIDTKANEMEVDTVWTDNPRTVYEKLYKYLSSNRQLGIEVIMRDKRVILRKVETQGSDGQT